MEIEIGVMLFLQMNLQLNWVQIVKGFGKGGTVEFI